MKTIHLQIDDSNYDSFLNIINNLKDGFIKGFKVDDSNDNIEFVSDTEQSYYEDILSNMSEEDKTVSSKESIQI